MKISHLTFSTSGGAGVAAQELHTSLIDASVDSTINFLIKDNLRKNKFRFKILFLRSIIDNFIIKNLKRNYFLSILRTQENNLDFMNLIDADILHLHWTPGFVDLNKLFLFAKKYNKKIVITLHDYWFFTGGCHYPIECKNFEKGCKECPATKVLFNNVPSMILSQKKEIFKNIDFKIIAPSTWIANAAQKSDLFSKETIYVIPNVVDVKKFYPIEKSKAKLKFKVKESNLNIGVCATDLSDPRKGIKGVLSYLIAHKNSIDSELSIFAIGSNLDKIIKKEARLNGINLIERTFAHDNSDLNEALNSLDFYIHSASEDNSPNIIREVIEIGLPVIAKNSGGVPEMLKGYSNGYLYEEPFELVSILNSSPRENLRNEENSLFFDNREILSKHLNIYASLYLNRTNNK
jgi:glycosyltransferase involved in cell wall biosynthesis